MIPSTVLRPVWLLFLASAAFLLRAGGEEEADALKPVLAEGDIPRFIETFPKMDEDFEKLGESFAHAEDLTSLQAMTASREVQAILKRHGWEPETFFVKMVAITTGFALLEIEREIANLPLEQRAMVEALMANQTGEMRVHPQDRERVRAQADKLRTFFDSMK